MAKARKDNKGRALYKGECQRSQDGRYVYTYTDIYGKRNYIYALTLMELREKEKELLRDRFDGLDRYTAEHTTLNQLVDRYMQTKDHLASSTYANYRYMYDRFCGHTIGKKVIKDLKYSDVLFFYQQIMKTGVNITTIESLHCVIHPALDMAVRDELIRKNPSDKVVSEIKRRVGSRARKKKALTVAEEKALIDYITENPFFYEWRPIIVFLLNTGCRIGEACGIRWSDVNLDNRTIDINHSMTFFRRGKKVPYTYEFKFGPTKSAAGNRIIPMTDDAYKVLSELKEKRIRYGAHGLVVDGARDFIFVRDGNLYKHTAIDHKLKVIVDSYNQQELHEAEIEGRVPLVLPYCSCHSFRHTFCTRLCEQESNIKAIQEIMGHADITTTMNIYAEATEGKKLEVMDNFSKRFEGDD